MIECDFTDEETLEKRVARSSPGSETLSDGHQNISLSPVPVEGFPKVYIKLKLVSSSLPETGSSDSDSLSSLPLVKLELTQTLHFLHLLTPAVSPHIPVHKVVKAVLHFPLTGALLQVPVQFSPNDSLPLSDDKSENSLTLIPNPNPSTRKEPFFMSQKYLSIH